MLTGMSETPLGAMSEVPLGEPSEVPEGNISNIRDAISEDPSMDRSEYTAEERRSLFLVAADKL